MAPKKTQDAYVNRHAALPDVRPHDCMEISRWLTTFHEIAHNFARLELNDVKKLEFECDMWRVQMISQQWR